ncbi:putative aminobenzoyl-glutamate transporter [Prevotella denticola]|uniref:Putative aminobenzoyl-glutamate transporter n=2 Tax=Prevotella denticola TaxID=28129 RepID=A0A379ED35_9BACT|nr:putative aminobenzoyl-glutamate transporter [Prevotella denticola]
MRMKSKLGWTVLVFVTAQLALILLSWLITAAFPELPIRSLLSSEGVRWFFGSFTANQLTPLLAWFITAAMAVGACVRSRLWAAFCTKMSGLLHRRDSTDGRQGLHYRERIGLRLALAEFMVYVVIMLLLTVVPHAILLSVTGELFPSAFSSSLIPSLSFVLIVMSLSYGVASGTVDSVARMHRVLVGGLEAGVRIVPAYVIGVQLYMSLLYVFMW